VSERQRARRRISVGVLLVSALAWAMLVSVPTHPWVVDLCASGATRWSWSLWAALLQGSAPGLLAAGWLLMLLAMMAPTLVAPLLHVHQRSFRRRRARSLGLFGLGYFALWMLAGVALTLLQLMVLSTAPADGWPALAALLLALLWQCSPAKQRCLNRSHNHRALAAFGRAADRDAFAFGLSHGVWCFGSCWALMLLPMLWVQGHGFAMLAVTAVMVGERLEGPQPPRWKLRGLGKPMRIAIVRARSLPFLRA
jgi:predicted metal-binding membrane protein